MTPKKQKRRWFKTSDLEKVHTNVSFNPETLKKADECVRERKIPGVNDRSGLIDYALQKVFEELKKKEPSR